MIKLYHCKGARSLRAVWALEELGIEHERIDMPFPPRVFHKEYKEENPLGTVPLLVDGNARITESAGCCHYLAEKYGPTDLAVTVNEPDFGNYINWLHRSDATLTFPQTLVLRYTILEPEERRNPQVAEDYKAWFLARLRCVEERTAEADYLVADRFTMADIAIGYVLFLANDIGIKEAFTPNIQKWWDRITERPAFQRIKDV